MSEINDLLDELVRSASTLHYVIDDNECPDKAFENLQKCKDAIISEITTHKQRITELEAERRWISVKDSLPTACEAVVLLLRKPNRDKESSLEIGHLDLVEDGRENMFLFIVENYDVKDELLLEDVTHWMPLPELQEV